MSGLTSREPFFIPAERWTRVSDPYLWKRPFFLAALMTLFYRPGRQLPHPPICLEVEQKIWDLEGSKANAVSFPAIYFFPLSLFPVKKI